MNATLALPEDNELIVPQRVIGEVNLLMIELSQFQKHIKVVSCQKEYRNQTGYFRITPECHKEMVENKGYYFFMVFDGTKLVNARMVKAVDVIYHKFLTWTYLMTEVIL